LRGATLRRFGEDEVLAIDDITAFVKTQAQSLARGVEELLVPEERVYSPGVVVVTRDAKKSAQ
jgi:hypothetical protein